VILSKLYTIPVISESVFPHLHINSCHFWRMCKKGSSKMKEGHHSVSPLRINIKQLCIEITFIPRRDTVFIPLQKLTGEWCFLFWKIITLCSEITQKHKNLLGQECVYSNWFHCIGSKNSFCLNNSTCCLW